MYLLYDVYDDGETVNHYGIFTDKKLLYDYALPMIREFYKKEGLYDLFVEKIEPKGIDYVLSRGCLKIEELPINPIFKED